MIEKAKSWFAGRSRREQWMLGVAGVLAALVIAVYGLILPGYAAIGSAERELEAATERRGKIEARAAILRQRPRDAAPTQVVAKDGRTLEAIMTESAAADGFEMTNGAASGVDEYAFRLASVKAGPLMVWLTRLEGQGIDLAEIKMRKGDGGFVAADIRVRRKP